MDEYSQGVCHDGAAILCNGVMLTIDEIVARLNRLAALEAEKAERERQEPVAWCDGSNLGIDVPELQFPAFRRKREFTDAPLYANPLAIREPSDEECAAIYRNYVCPPVPCEEVSSDVELGRLMVRAVREVLK